MKKFVQEMMQNAMLKKLTVAFPMLRKKELNEKDIQDIRSTIQKTGLLDALTNSGQSPDEIAEMGMEAFDKSVTILRTRYKEMVDRSLSEIKNNEINRPK